MKFFIPERTKIFGQTISIKFEDNLQLDGKPVDGLSIFNENLIQINAGRDGLRYAKSQQELTYMHELCHQIFDHLGEHKKSQNEKFIYNLSSCFYQYLSSSVYHKPKDFIPKEFMICGQKTKVTRKNKIIINGDSGHLASLSMYQNKIEVLNYGLETEGYLIPDEKIDTMFLRPIISWIFHLIGYNEMVNNHNLNMRLASTFHQTLTSGEKWTKIKEMKVSTTKAKSNDS